MVEAQENKINETKEADYSDLQSLLEAADLSEFNLEQGYTEEKQEFEKFENFFEIIKSTADEEAQSKQEEVNDTQETTDAAEDSQKDGLNEDKLLNNEEFEQKENLEENSEQVYEQTNKIATTMIENDDVSDGSLEQMSSTEQSEKEQQVISNASASKDDDSKCSPEEVDQNKVEKELFNSELEKNAYEMGHKDALEEFERSMELEKKSLQELTNTLFSINDKLQEATESLLKEKLFELFDELIGEKLSEFEEKFIAKIKAASNCIIAVSNAVQLELNHSDFKILKSNANLESLGFEVSEKPDLRRGEFRLVHDSSGFQQKFNK